MKILTPEERTTSEAITQWLKDHPLISVRGIEQEAGLPATTLQKAMSSTVPPKHHDKIIQVLKRYGL
jgi:hypothetical protein